MKSNKVKFMLMFCMFILSIGVAFATLNIENTFIDVGNNLTYNYNVYDENGLIVDADCDWELFSNSLSYATGSGNINTEIETGEYSLNVYCDYNSTQGGFLSDEFESSVITIGGLEWKEPTSWTFPVVYLILTIIVILLGLNYKSGLIGVLGSIMLIFSYFLIGATSPLLFSPILILGLLLAFKFSSM